VQAARLSPNYRYSMSAAAHVEGAPSSPAAALAGVVEALRAAAAAAEGVDATVASLVQLLDLARVPDYRMHLCEAGTGDAAVRALHRFAADRTVEGHGCAAI